MLARESRKANDNCLSFVGSHGDCDVRLRTAIRQEEVRGSTPLSPPGEEVSSKSNEVILDLLLISKRIREMIES